MALKPYRSGPNQLEYNVISKMDEVGEAGSVVVLKTAGTGTPELGSQQIVEIATATTGFVVGVLNTTVISLDTTKYIPSTARNEVAVGENVSIITRGIVVTNKLGASVTAGLAAVLGAEGIAEDAPASWNPLTKTKVGYFITGKDAAGYAALMVEPVPEKSLV